VNFEYDVAFLLTKAVAAFEAGREASLLMRAGQPNGAYVVFDKRNTPTVWRQRHARIDACEKFYVL
jgi:hypothetical protein